jgi:hypothetical protein
MLTEEEIDLLRASTLNPHYTRLDVVRTIHESIERLGLAAWGRLRILEPAAGIGHFLTITNLRTHSVFRPSSSTQIVREAQPPDLSEPPRN